LTIFFISFPSGVAAAALQEITPGPLRGRVTALYYLAINILGLSIGSSSVALITDKVFHRQSMLPSSMLIVTVIFGPIGAWLIFHSLRFFRQAAASPV
jgi:MFS family permease